MSLLASIGSPHGLALARAGLSDPHPSALTAAVHVLLVTFAPVFCANLLFAREFATVEESDRSFGWNLLGAVAGGGAEILSLVLGLRHLLLLALGLYLATAFLLATPRR